MGTVSPLVGLAISVMSHDFKTSLLFYPNFLKERYYGRRRVSSDPVEISESLIPFVTCR